MTVLDQHTLVTALLEVPGVLTASLEPTAVGPGALRLQLLPGADEVDVAGAVNRLLRSGFGLAVDAERVRVLPAPASMQALVPDQTRGAAPADDSVAEPVDPVVVRAVEREQAVRLLVDRVEHVSHGLGVVVTVTLTVGARSVLGQAEGAATTTGQQRAVAAATLRGIEKVVTGHVRFDVEHVEIAGTGEERTALVVLSMLSDRATQRLSGSSVLRDDASLAIVRAILAAVNRRIEPLLR